jgi:hypothetical protein
VLVSKLRIKVETIAGQFATRWKKLNAMHNIVAQAGIQVGMTSGRAGMLVLAAARGAGVAIRFDQIIPPG